jgi:hypothetical protein
MHNIIIMMHQVLYMYPVYPAIDITTSIDISSSYVYKVHDIVLNMMYMFVA